MNIKTLIAIAATTASLSVVPSASAGGIGFHFSVGIGGRSQRAVEQPPVYVVQQAPQQAATPAVAPATVPATPVAGSVTPAPAAGAAPAAPPQPATVQQAPATQPAPPPPATHPAPGTTVYPGGTTVVGNQVVYTPVSTPPPQSVYSRRSWGVGPYVDTGFRWGQHYYPPAGHSY